MSRFVPFIQSQLPGHPTGGAGQLLAAGRRGTAQLHCDLSPFVPLATQVGQLPFFIGQALPEFAYEAIGKKDEAEKWRKEPNAAKAGND